MELVAINIPATFFRWGIATWKGSDAISMMRMPTAALGGVALVGLVRMTRRWDHRSMCPNCCTRHRILCRAGLVAHIAVR